MMGRIWSYPEFLNSWVKLTTACVDISLNASEVIFRRTMKIASGEMSRPEAVAMVLEKATAFASATERATVAAARGGDAIGIASAALKPYRTKTRSNARRLRG
ncbi:MAG: hypothetical protein ABTQ27_08675 [Amaricoccus sp.]